MNIFYKISIDNVNGNYISGWCHHRFCKNRPVVLQLFRNDELVAETPSDRFREDLKALQLHPTGDCGFEFVSSIDEGFGLSEALEIRLKGAKASLAKIDIRAWSGQPQTFSQRLKRGFLPKTESTETVVFMHIPKTAGTSFNTLAQAFFPAGSTISHIELVPGDHYPALRQNYRYISGHLRFGLLQQHFQKERTAFYTIIREPYRQLHSHLKWMIQTAKNPDETFFKATNEVIYRLGLKLAGIDFTSLSSVETFVDSLDDLEAAFLDNVQTRYFLDTPVQRVGDRELETALANASIFRLIGLTERYDDFVRRFKTYNGIDVETDLQQMNISASTNLFDYREASVREVLRPLVSLDLKLYAHITGGQIK